MPAFTPGTRVQVMCQATRQAVQATVLSASADALHLAPADSQASQTPQPTTPTSSPLASAIDTVLGKLRAPGAQPYAVDGLNPEHYELPPVVSRTVWAALGDEVKRAERETALTPSVCGSKWLSLRLDGSGFSKHLRVLRRAGALPQGFSPQLAGIMQKCTASLMDYTHAYAGYTQSDELTVLIPPARVVRGEQMPHLRNGRVQKMLSLSAAHVTALFNLCIAELLPEGYEGDRAKLLGVFDCRVAAYDTLHEASGVLLWRAYDSGLNGVADAVFQRKGSLPDAGSVMKLSTQQKLAFLLHHNVLPLHPHQAYGTFFRKELVAHAGVNPQTGEVVNTTRRKIVQQPSRNLVSMLLEEELVYTDTGDATVGEEGGRSAVAAGGREAEVEEEEEEEE